VVRVNINQRQGLVSDVWAMPNSCWMWGTSLACVISSNTASFEHLTRHYAEYDYQRPQINENAFPSVMVVVCRCGTGASAQVAYAFERSRCA